MKLTIDFETRSVVTNLKATGPWPYAEHPSTKVLCLAYKLGSNKPRLWLPGDGGNNDLIQAIEAAEVIEAHNVQFEQAVWHHYMHRQLGFPDLPVHKLRDTAAVAAMHALPRPLGQVCEVLGLQQQKDKEGYDLMMKMCKPRAPRKAEWELLGARFKSGNFAAFQDLKAAYDNAGKGKLDAMCALAADHWEDMQGMILWHDDPEDLKRLCQYCVQDVEAEYALSQRLGELPAMELQVFQHDLVVNRRGVQVDKDMVAAAMGVALEHESRLLSELDLITNGTVRTVKQVAAGLDWLHSRNVHLDNLQAETVRDALKMDMSEDARRFLEIRQSLGMASVAKYEAARAMTCEDGRLRGFSMYHGAGTGRWAGKGVQLHNLPRGVFDLGQKPDKDGRKLSEEAFWLAVDLVRDGNLDGLMIEFGDPMPILSSVIRPVLTAAPGKELLAADFSAIEGRGLAWLAREEWVLDAYRAYDRGEGPDMYMVTAGKILGKSADRVSKTERKNPGKPADLGCFGPDTRVLASNGIKRIAEVSTSDRLWDGVEWVPHDGLIEKGEKAVIDLCGVEVTPDHLIHAGRWGWKQARTVASCGSMRLRALEKGSENLPSLAWREYAAAPYRSCKKGSTNLRPVFDILNSGSRNRFTILSDDGPLLVHNCGYQGGFNALGKFNATVPVESRAQWIAEWIRRNVKANPEALAVFEQYVENGATEESLCALAAQGWPYPSEAELFEIWGRDVVNKWRAARPLTVNTWAGLEKAAMKAVEEKTSTVYERIEYHYDGQFLKCRLPSGRFLYYPFPDVLLRDMPWGTARAQFSHMTVDATTKRWIRRFAHGGLLVENCVQAICRDILAQAMLRLEAAGFPVVLHVHDEIVAEVPKGTKTLEEFIEVMTAVPDWAAGFPISASGWAGERYRKD